MFEWDYLTSAITNQPRTVYKLDGVEIARLTRKVDEEGVWQAILKQHRVAEPRIYRRCTSFESGKRGVELWAERHREQLQADVDKIKAMQPNWMGGRRG